MEKNLYEQQRAWLQEQHRKVWYWALFPFVLLYLGFCWLNWKLTSMFDLELTPSKMGTIIWACMTSLWLFVTSLAVWRFIVALPFMVSMIFAIFFHVGAPSGAVNSFNRQHAPTVAPTAYGGHTRSNWLDSMQFLSPLQAQKLRSESDVTNVVVITEATGRIQISSNFKSNPASTAWELQQSYPFAISNVSVGPGKGATVTIDTNDITLNQGQAFVLSQDPTVAYMVGSDGSIYVANTTSPGIVAITTVIPSPHLPANPTMTLPQ